MTDIAFPTRQTYLSEDDYFSDGVIGSARKQSRELDFGVWHRETDRPHPVYRVSYVTDSNEVIAVCLGGKPRGQITVLASGVPEDQIHDLLDGWADVCGDYSIPWMRERLKMFPVKLA